MLQFTQNEVERGLNDFLTDANKREIAKLTGLYEQVIYGMFNPDNERKSASFTFLQIQTALDEINPELGEKHWKMVCHFREMSKKRRQTGELTPLNCFSQQISTFGNFGAELTRALHDGKLDKKEILTLQPFMQQLREFCDMFDDLFGNALQKEAIQEQNFGDLKAS